MTDHTAVGVRVALNAGFHAARARLRILAKGGTLPQACEVAYGEGITGLAELAGPAAGLTRLAGVCLEELTETDDCAHIALQWEAIAADGTLFTALLADLMLVPAGDQITALSVTGTYWPPPGRAGAGLGQVIVRRCATTVLGSFLDSLACELVHPAGMAGLLAAGDGNSPLIASRPASGQRLQWRPARVYPPLVIIALRVASAGTGGVTRGHQMNSARCWWRNSATGRGGRPVISWKVPVV